MFILNKLVLCFNNPLKSLHIIAVRAINNQISYLYYIYIWAYFEVRAPDFRTMPIVKRVATID